MQKITYILLLSIILLGSKNIQAQDYMDKITRETCSCLKDMPTSTKYDDLILKLGLCVLESSGPYEKKLKKDFKININNTDHSQKLGRLIGIRMGSECPDQLRRLVDVANAKNETNETGRISGEILSIRHGDVVVFTIKDASDNIQEVIWLGKIQTEIYSFENNFKNIEHDMVNVNYETQLLFDPKIKSYRNFKVLTKINKQEED